DHVDHRGDEPGRRRHSGRGGAPAGQRFNDWNTVETMMARMISRTILIQLHGRSPAIFPVTPLAATWNTLLPLVKVSSQTGTRMCLNFWSEKAESTARFRWVSPGTWPAHSWRILPSIAARERVAAFTRSIW